MTGNNGSIAGRMTYMKSILGEMEITPTQVMAIRQLVNYLEEDEKENWEEMGDWGEDRKGHIYESVRICSHLVYHLVREFYPDLDGTVDDLSWGTPDVEEAA